VPFISPIVVRVELASGRWSWTRRAGCSTAMRCDVLTLFPAASRRTSRSGRRRAVGAGILEARVHDLRRWAGNPLRPGRRRSRSGWPGMVLMAPVVVRAVREVAASDAAPAQRRAPRRRGRRFTDAVARDSPVTAVSSSCAALRGLRRARARPPRRRRDLARRLRPVGSELAALAVNGRRRPPRARRLGDPGSVAADSFTSGLLDHPVYTRPRCFEGSRCPRCCSPGTTEAIRRWRLREAKNLQLTKLPSTHTNR